AVAVAAIAIARRLLLLIETKCLLRGRRGDDVIRLLIETAAFAEGTLRLLLPAVERLQHVAAAGGSLRPDGVGDGDVLDLEVGRAGIAVDRKWPKRRTEIAGPVIAAALA